MAITQQQYYPYKAGEIQVNTYFQKMAIKDGKKVMGLETVQAQINALYGGLTMQQQIALLHERVNREDGLRKMIAVMNKAYISQNLGELQELMYGTYDPQEMKALLDERNNQWIKQLSKLMKEQTLLVAVESLHLAGESGLVNQLRKKGYTLRPIKLSHP